MVSRIRRSNPRPTIRPPSPKPTQTPPILNRSRGLGTEISLVAAFSFVFSAASNWFTFQMQWGLDYFSIATPQDVVMDGFRMTASVLFAAVLGTLFIFTVLPTLAWVVAKVMRTVNPAKPVSVWTLIFSKTAKKTWGTVALSFQGILIICFTLMALQTFWFRYDGGIYYQQTGLYVLEAPGLPDVCRFSPIVWMGSQAAVIHCDDRVLVERDFGRLQMIRPFLLERPLHGPREEPAAK